MIEFEVYLKRLSEAHIEFVVIGGVAAAFLGSSYATYDLDICYNRTKENLEKISDCLLPLNPKLRNAPEDLPFTLDAPTLKAGLNFTLETTLGKIDLLGEVGGVGFYKEVKTHSKEIRVDNFSVWVLNLDALIKSKKFAGRKKDEPVIVELEAIKEMLSSSN
ncbi:MAG: hypothetical protein HYZ34_14815 [Ignavibacteriae bacterium]|nr:hypothetical protein [Ignavibacteriota bacterium]